MFYFFQTQTPTDPVVKRAERRVVTFKGTGVEYELLTPDVRNNIEMLELRLKPGQYSDNEPCAHKGEECAVLIHGVVNVEIGDATYRLQPGDSIYIGALHPHRVYNPGKETAVMISAISPPSF